MAYEAPRCVLGAVAIAATRRTRTSALSSTRPNSLTAWSNMTKPKQLEMFPFRIVQVDLSPRQLLGILLNPDESTSHADAQRLRVAGLRTSDVDMLLDASQEEFWSIDPDNPDEPPTLLHIDNNRGIDHD